MSTTSSLLSPSPRFLRASPSLPWSASPSSNGATAKGSPPAGDTDSFDARDASSAAISLQNLGKTFGETIALDTLNLDIAPGELVALLGPSGSGKTTLLRLVAGLEEPTRGRILFGSEDATRLPVRDRRVGFVFQHYALFKHMSVAENIAYGLRVRPRRQRPASAEIDRRVAELLDLMRLSGLGARLPAQLSGGQRQRVALARALAVDPRVLLLDEPFGALDAQVRRDLRRWLREVHDRTGHTTLFVTHDQQEALELADRVAILHRGRLEQVGPADAILDHPASAFVAGFIGEAVRLPATVTGHALQLGGISLKLAEPAPPGEAALFVRPEDLVLARDAEDSLPAQVLAVRRSGAVRRLEVAIGSGGLPVVEMELPRSFSVRKGDVLRVRLATVRLFPVE